MPPRHPFSTDLVLRSIDALASCQQGAFTHDQAINLGATDTVLQSAVRSGRYRRPRRGLYLAAAAPPTWNQDAMAAVLDAGPEATLSHRTSAALHGLDEFSRAEIEVTTARHARRRTRAPRTYRLHESTDLRSFDLEVVDGLPRTTAVRTFIDLGASATRFEVERAFDDAVRRRIVTVAAVRQRYLEVARQGRRGCGAIGYVLRRDDPTATRSNTFEKLVLTALRMGGVPEPVAQHRVDGPSWTYWVDLAWPNVRLALECDSVAFHGAGRQVQHDDTRQNHLVLAGWTFLRYTWDDAKHRGPVIAAQTLDLLDALPPAG